MTFNSKVKHTYYCKDGKSVEYFYVNKIPAYYAEVLDFYITLLKDQETNEIIGIQLQPESIKRLTKTAKKETKAWFKKAKKIDTEIENIEKFFRSE